MTQVGCQDDLATIKNRVTKDPTAPLNPVVNAEASNNLVWMAVKYKLTFEVPMGQDTMLISR